MEYNRITFLGEDIDYSLKTLDRLMDLLIEEKYAQAKKTAENLEEEYRSLLDELQGSNWDQEGEKMIIIILLIGIAILIIGWGVIRFNDDDFKERNKK